MPVETLEAPSTSPAAAPAPSTESATPATSNANPSTDRALFDSMVRKHNLDGKSGQPDAQDTQPEDDQGNAAPPATEPATTGEPATLTVTEKAKEYAGVLGLKTDDQNALLDAAVEAFRRQNILDSDDITEKFNRNESKFIEAGLKLAKMQKDQDSFGGKAREFEKDPDAYIEKHLKAKGVSQPQRQQELPPLPERVNGIITQALDKAKFVNELGEFDQEAFTQSFGVTLTGLAQEIHAENANAIKTLQEQHQAELQKRDGDIEFLRTTWVDQQLAQARAQLTAKYPALANEEAWQKVLTEPGGYDDLAATGKFNIPDAVARAAAAIYGEETTQSIRDSLLKQHKLRQTGQPRTPASVTPKELTGRDRDRQAFNEIMKKRYGKGADAL